MFNLKTFQQKSPQQRFLFILGLVFFIVYLGLGLCLIFWKDIPYVDLKPNYRLLLGLLLIVYAGFRFYRIINQNDN